MSQITKPIILDETGQDIATAISSLANRANDIENFTSSDVADGSATAWTSVTPLASGEVHSSIFAKISQMFKNVRYLYKMLGTTDISSIGGGTVTGAISSLNSKMPWTQIGEVTQSANTSLDELVTVDNMSNAREIMFTIQRSSNGRTFASSVVPLSQFSSGAIYAFGAYALYTGPLQSGGIIGVNAVCIWQTATQVEIAANTSTEALKYRVWMR